MPKISRRDFLASGLVAIGATLAGPGLWRRALAAPAQTGAGPYGPLLAPDANGVRLPEGFSSRIIARSQALVSGTAYLWHTFPDGGATYPTDDGGWIYVSNSEVPGGLGGAGAIRFDADAEIVDAYPILTGTSSNCAGGPTPWGTWLSCEETDTGRVWEADPFGIEPGVVHPAMGVFTHEAAAVDDLHQRVYLTEDEGSGRFYRFTPSAYPNLVSGLLEVARVHDLEGVTKGGRSAVSWMEVPDPSASSTPTREQVADSTPFRGGEGTWFDSGIVYFTTKSDNRVWAYDTFEDEMELIYDDGLTPNPPLSGVDNVFVSSASGDMYVAEDGGDLQLVVITPDREVAPFLQLVGPEHDGSIGIPASELAGPAMDPAQNRFYFSSQRGAGWGITYEVTGPFRQSRVLASSTVVRNGDEDQTSVAGRQVTNSDDGASVSLPQTGPTSADSLARSGNGRDSTGNGLRTAATSAAAAASAAALVAETTRRKKGRSQADS
jgi:hypothetical protein